MKSYEIQFQSLTVLVIQLLTTQQSSISTSVRECIKRGVVVQSEPSSPCINDASLSIMKSSRYSSRSPRIDHRQHQTSISTTTDGVSSCNMCYFSCIIINFFKTIIP
jgi:hypothetical protein